MRPVSSCHSECGVAYRDKPAAAPKRDAVNLPLLASCHAALPCTVERGVAGAGAATAVSEAKASLPCTMERGIGGVCAVAAAPEAKRELRRNEFT